MKPTGTPTARELLTEEQIGVFLAAIMEGETRSDAAKLIGQTGRAMKSLARPERDPEFAALYAEAEAVGKEAYQDELRATSRERAKEISDRMLEVELATHVPEYGHLRRDRVRHEGRIEHALVLDLSKLEELGDDELAALEPVLEKLAHGELKALPPPAAA